MPKFNPLIGLQEYLLDGNFISIPEAFLLFGAQSLTADLRRLKEKGFVVKSQRVPFAKIIRRMNEHMICQPPKDLPIREIVVTEYWINK